MISLAQVIQNALEREAYDFYGAPAILLVSDKKTNPHYLANCAVALENIFLQEFELGPVLKDLLHLMVSLIKDTCIIVF